MFNKIATFLKPKASYPTVINAKNGLILWTILLSGYLLFVLNWIIIGRLGGQGTAAGGGWLYSFFSGKADETTTQAVNYSITFVRGIATLFVAWIMVKISHKYATIIAMLLLTASFPAVFMPNYVLFIIGRMFMAIGGTMLIIFIQPVMSRFFSNKGRGYLSIISPWGYSLGSLIAFSLFVNSITAGVLIQNWRIVAAVAAGLTYVPLILYIIFGKNFNIVKSAKANATSFLKPATYKEIIKEKETWIWILFYGLWLVLAVLTTLLVPEVLIAWNPELRALRINGLLWRSLFSVMFYVGSILGFWIGFWNRAEAKRKPFGNVLAFLILFFFVLIIIGGRSSSQQVIVALTLIGGFFVGMFSKGAQSVFLYIPHEYEGNSPKRITIFFGYIWGFGYIFYSIMNIVSSLMLDIHEYQSSFSKENSAIVAITFILALVFLFFVLSFFLREAKPDSPYWPEKLKFWKTDDIRYLNLKTNRK